MGTQKRHGVRLVAYVPEMDRQLLRVEAAKAQLTQAEFVSKALREYVAARAGEVQRAEVAS
jgi:hypothetical protein